MENQIRGMILGQALALEQDFIVAGTREYITATFQFSPEWDGLSIWAHFDRGNSHWKIHLHKGEILRSDKLNLTQGAWEVSLHGTAVDGMRITTEPVDLSVRRTNIDGDEPLGGAPASPLEQLDQRVTALEAGGGGGGGGGTTDHSMLTNRDQPDQHPIEAITGLREELDGKQSVGSSGYIDLSKYGITAADYVAPFTSEMFEVAHKNGIGFNAAVADAKASGENKIIIPPGRYPVCWEGKDDEPNPVIDAGTVDIWGYGVTLYVIFDDLDANPYNTATDKSKSFGCVIQTSGNVYGLHIVGERQYRATDPGRRDKSCGIGLDAYSHGNHITDCVLEYISGDGAGYSRPGINIANWPNDKFASLEYDQNTNAYVESRTVFRSTKHGVSFIKDITKPVILFPLPNFFYTVDFVGVRCFDADGNHLGLIHTNQGQYFNFYPGTAEWYIELYRSIEHDPSATETLTYFLREGYYSGTIFEGCVSRYNQRGGMSNLPDKSVVDRCHIYRNGSKLGDMPEYADGTRFGIDLEDVVTTDFTLKNSVISECNQGVIFKSRNIAIMESDVSGYFSAVSGLNGCVNFYAQSSNFLQGTVKLKSPAPHGMKVAIGCNFANPPKDIAQIKTPEPLTFTGAVEATYDGSVPITVHIPSESGREDFRLIRELTTVAPTDRITVKTDDDGSEFTLNEIFVELTGSLTNDSASDRGYQYVYNTAKEPIIFCNNEQLGVKDSVRSITSNVTAMGSAYKALYKPFGSGSANTFRLNAIQSPNAKSITGYEITCKDGQFNAGAIVRVYGR